MWYSPKRVWFFLRAVSDTIQGILKDGLATYIVSFRCHAGSKKDKGIILLHLPHCTSYSLHRQTICWAPTNCFSDRLHTLWQCSRIKPTHCAKHCAFRPLWQREDQFSWIYLHPFRSLQPPAKLDLPAHKCRASGEIFQDVGECDRLEAEDRPQVKAKSCLWPKVVIGAT